MASAWQNWNSGRGPAGAITPPAPPSVPTAPRAAQKHVQPIHLVYVTVLSRTTSFWKGSGWPKGKRQKPEELASAGFFFAGIQDCTRCFFCGIGLKNWLPGDDPITEHQKFSAGCEFLKKLMQPRLFETPEEIGKNKRDINLAVNCVLAKPCGAALSVLGYPDALIRQAIIQVLAEKDWDDTGVTSEQLVLTLFHLEEREEKTMSDLRESPRAIEEVYDVPRTTTSPTSSLEEDILPPKTGKGSMTVSALEEENRKLKASRECKICMDKEASVVYLPCGHLVTCQDCYSSQSRCPICRTKISAYVKIFT